MAANPVSYVTVGHLAKDLTPNGARLGGTAAYSALTARAFGYPPGIVTAAGTDLDLAPLAGLPVHCLPSEASTTFENIYGPGGRTQYLRAQAVHLPASAIPTDWQAANLIHVAPLANEVHPDLLSVLHGPFVGLTPQGWLRQWDQTGRVAHSLSAWPDPGEALSRAEATIVSVVDLGGEWAVAEQWARSAAVLVVTEGASGCTVFVRGHGARQLRAPKVDELDPTGAGDVFAAAFFIHLYETDDPWAAARLANQVAALSVTRIGLDGVPSEVEAAFCRVQAAAA